ncbi:MADS-box protein FBP24 [Linum grandiflorum]
MSDSEHDGPPLRAARGGRQKIEIKKIKNKNSRYVAFSRRRTGLAKKLEEFCILSKPGTEAAMVTFSPTAKRPHVYGFPSAVGPILSRFLDQVEQEKMTDSPAEENKEELEEKEAAWLKLRRDLETRMSEETIREATTREFLV